MAAEVVSKEDLLNELERIKGKERKARDARKRENEQLAGDIFSIGGAVGGAFLVSQLAKGVKESDDYKSKTAEQQEEALAEAMTIGGIDIDAVAGAVLFGLGVTDMVGNFSDTSRQLGLGALNGFIGRYMYHKLSEPEEKTE